MAATTDKEVRKAIMKDIILKLHEGLSVQEARHRFEEEIGNITSLEIAEIEQSLINDGLPPEEIKKFCNVHALLFESALRRSPSDETFPSHPVYLFKLENREVEKVVEAIKQTMANQGEVKALRDELKEMLLKLRQVNTHYERKEQLLFPYLEKAGFMGPSKVMWGKDNEIREMFKDALDEIERVSIPEGLATYRDKFLGPLLEEVLGMVFKEENILFPASLEKLASSDWVEILRESEDIGYVFIQKPEEAEVLVKQLQSTLVEGVVIKDNAVSLPSGLIQLDELLPLLNTLPFDFTFVDREDTVRYFSEGKGRVFHRPRSIIGRKVQNCHPPQSLEIVEKILGSFKDGLKDFYEFWINFQGRLVHIRYFAVRNARAQYLGTLEVTQDITDIRKIEGEKRLLDERS